MSDVTRRLDSLFYPGRHRSWDDDIFRDRILQFLNQDDILLDLGAGSGRIHQMDFRGLASKCAGIDPDEAVLENGNLDEAKVCAGECIDYPDSSFDIVISANTLEHIAKPDAVFKEVARILKPKGRFLFKTPNNLHYGAIGARLTPTSFHKFYNSRRGRPPEHTFPTHYRANSRKKIGELAQVADFEVESIEIIEDRPEYLRIHPLLYCLGIAYERTVNLNEVFERFRSVIIGILLKKG